MENDKDIVQKYFEQMSACTNIACKKVIFEPETKTEWFFFEDCWCYFEFYCEDNEYTLRRVLEKEFCADCILKDMSYEIKMLLAYIQLRGVVTVEKELFSTYVNNFEKTRETKPDLSIEKYNFDLKEKEEQSLLKSDKIANGIMAGCLALVAAVVLLFVAAIISYVKMHYFS